MSLNRTEKNVLIGLLAVLFILIAVRYVQEKHARVHVTIVHPEPAAAGPKN